MCVSSHFWPFTKANLVLENFNKNLGFGQTPPPLVGPNAQIFPKMHFEGSPKGSNEKAQSPKNSAMGGEGGTPFSVNFFPLTFWPAVVR